MNRNEKITAAPKNQQLLRGYAALAIGTLALSISPILVKWVNAPTVVTSFYRMAITSVFLTVILLFRRHTPDEAPAGQKRKLFPFILFPILAGLSSGMDHGFWAYSLTKTSVSNAVFLNSMAPVWIALFSMIFLHEKFNGKFWLGLAIAASGMFFMSGKGLDFFKEGFNEGDRIALLSSVFYCGYFLFTQLGRDHFTALKQLWISNIAGAVMLLLFCIFFGYSLTGYSPSVWVGFLLTALVGQLIGYFSLTYALGTLPASVVGPTDQLHSVLSSLIAIPVFGEKMSAHQIAGGACIAVGTFLINKGKLDQIQDTMEKQNTAGGG